MRKMPGKMYSKMSLISISEGYFSANVRNVVMQLLKLGLWRQDSASVEEVSSHTHRPGPRTQCPPRSQPLAPHTRRNTGRAVEC